MLKTAIITTVSIIVLGLSTLSSSAQRPVPGQMGVLLGVGGTVNPGGGTSSATAVTDLVFMSNGVLYGTAYAYDGSHFELYTTDGGVLKTFANSCQPAPVSNGVAGVVCSFGHFNRDGQQLYSGWTYIYANGVVYLRWMYSYRSNFQYVFGDTGWIGLRPKS